jgi:hypothetical protein
MIKEQVFVAYVNRRLVYGNETCPGLKGDEGGEVNVRCPSAREMSRRMGVELAITIAW